MKKILACVAVSSLLPSLVYAASLQSLDRSQVLALFENHTVTSVSMVTLNDRMINNTFTGYWTKDGNVIGQFAHKPVHANQGDKGVWEVKKDGSLCVTWEHWENAAPHCVNVYQTKNMVLFVNKRQEFESAALKEDFVPGDQMN